MTMITYQNGCEVIITTLEREHEAIKLYFIDSNGRSLEDYQRCEHGDCAIDITVQSLCIG